MRSAGAWFRFFTLMATAGACTPATPAPQVELQPEMATGRRGVPLVRTSTTMVVAANPHASRAGHTILKAGGSAVDAAVAVQAVLTLVEPQSSGIGGGAFMLHWATAGGALRAYDGREVAPAAATPDLFLHPDGSKLDFAQALVGGRAVGVPGVLRMLEVAHRAHGRLPWQDLFAPAIALCEQGFEVSPRLNKLLASDPFFPTQPAARALFYRKDGTALPVGHRLKNPALARVLRAVAKEGADALHEGPIAQAIVDAVTTAKRPETTVADLRALMTGQAPRRLGMASVPNPGRLTAADLAAYAPKTRAPVCVDYRQWKVCGFGPPTSGGITTLQIFKLLEGFDLSKLSPRSVEFAHLVVEASKLAFADRGRYVGDPDFVDVPVAGLLDDEYLAERAKLIRPDRAGPKAKPGQPPGVTTAFADGTDHALPSTSHFVVVDGQGDVVSMTSSVENVFGARLVVEGFVLNNQLTDFSFSPGTASQPVANAVAAGKRPRSSMSPLIVLDRPSGRPVLAVGSPGGSRIIGFVAYTTLAILDGGLTPQAAIDLPHVVNRNGVTELEDEGWAPGELDAVKSGLQALGHEVKVSYLNSGLHAVRITGDGLLGGADPRREGLAVGD